MKTSKIHRAQSDSQPVTIVIDEQLPELERFGDEPLSEWLQRSAERFNKEGRRLEEALHCALPGGTYDRLLGYMLARKASHFVTPFGTDPDLWNREHYSKED